MSSLGLNFHGTPPGSDKPPDLGLTGRGLWGDGNGFSSHLGVSAHCRTVDVLHPTQA